MEADQLKIKILAIDDHPSNLIALQSVFSGSNYQLIEASSGPEALKILNESDEIAVALLDVQMPVMDGFETALRIKQIPGYNDLPIIFITAVFHEDPFIKQGYKAGAIDYFSKPFDPEILKSKVSIYASMKQKTTLLKEREQRLIEMEELARAGRKLSAILQTLSAGVLIADNEGKICQVNEAVSKILKSNEAIDDDYGKILGWWTHQGKILKDESSPLALALYMGASTHNKMMDIQCQDGTQKTILVSASPLKAIDQHIVGAVIIIQDITETKEIEKDFEGRMANLISLSVGFEQEASAKN